MSQTYTINCDGMPVELTGPQVEGMAAALTAYLSNPENTKGQPDWAQPYLQPPPPLSIPEGMKGVATGFWHLTCLSAGSFSWTQRPSQTLLYVASLGWDEENDRYFIRGLRLSNLSARTR